MRTRALPHNFIVGCATSAFQIEGATDVDGRGESIWDRFTARPGAIEDGCDGTVACDHYRRYRDDVALMADLGVRAYRFSVAWPRVLPTGRGTINAAGLAFYDRLVDALLVAGIRPFATLYHWDLPQALEELGGWRSRDTVHAFVEYADVVARTLGDRVKDWITHNEPWCISVLGHQDGVHAPGRKSVPEALAAAHHVLLSHGLSVPVIRDRARGARVGITLNLSPGYAASPSPEDAAARRRFDGWFNRWYLDPLYGKGYPADVVREYEARGELPSGTLPFVASGDLEAIAAKTDFLGVNYYTRAILRDDAVPEHANAAPNVVRAPASEDTDMGWEVYPNGLHDLLLRLRDDYAPEAIHITECGAAYGTEPDAAGRVRDTRRVRFLHDHLDATLRAVDAGVPVRGFFVWSLLDNFEWAFGYRKRFGIVWVDYTTQERSLKDSAKWLREVLRSGALLAPSSEHASGAMPAVTSSEAW